MDTFKRNKLLLSILVGFVALIILIFSINALFSKPYGKEIKIKNLAKTFSLSSDEEHRVNSQLYEAVSKNSDTIPSSAIIRKTISSSENGYRSFLVDLEDIKQSYLIQFNFSETPPSIVISCPTEDLLIYGVFQCNDTEQELNNNQPIWYNTYQLNYTLSTVASQKIQSALNEFFADNDPTDTVTIDETSIDNYNHEDYAFTFKLSTDKNTYTAIVKVDETYGGKYIDITLQDSQKTVFIKNITN